MKMLKVVLLIACVLAVRSSNGQVFRTLFVPKEYIVYQGYEASMAMRSFSFKSDISQLQHLRVSQVGASVGVVFANQVGKIRPTLGLYYSDGNTRYTIDQAEVSVSANLYFLRQFSEKSRFFEPYVVTSVGYQRMKFFGTYLGDGIKNYSVGSQPELGTIDLMRMSTGLGVEAQFVNDAQQFIHLFAEVLTGFTARTRSSRSEFSHTNLHNTTRFTIGISVGLAKF